MTSPGVTTSVFLKHIAVFFALSVTWQASADYGCPGSLYRHGINCYWFYTGWYFPWTTSESSCLTYKYPMATFHTPEEREWLGQVIKENGYDFWVGIRRINGQWLWADNQTYQYDARDWVPGSPPAGSSLLCAYASPCTAGKWKEASCDVRKRTICIKYGIHGGWGAWSQWTLCSKTCGTGRQSRKRLCNNPTPVLPGTTCIGMPDEYRMCNEQYCPVGWATCNVGGDPHYLTFDRQPYDFQGGDIQGRECKFLLAGRCKHESSLPPFKILASNDHRGNPRVSWVKAIELHYQSHVIRVDTSFRTTGQIFVDGVRVYADNFRGISGVTVSKRTNTIRLSIENGLVYVSYNGHRTVTVGADKCLKGTGGLCGLCGNYDGNKPNDLYLRNGTASKDRNDLGWSYQEPNQDGRFCHMEIVQPCSIRTCQHANLCNILASQDVFGSCPGYYNAKDACVTDMCCAPRNPPNTCEIFRDYVDECNRMGHTVPATWQQKSRCADPTCPANSAYVSTADACQPTCTGVIDGCKNIFEKGACVCKAGYVWFRNVCIPKAHCGCVDQTGQVHPIGSTWLNNCCTTRYQCTKTGNAAPTITVSSVRCHAAARCGLINGQFTCQCMPGFTGSGYTCSAFRCPSTASRLYENPLHCNRYYLCRGGFARAYPCSDPLYYNDEVQGCVLAPSCPARKVCATKLKGLVKRQQGVNRIWGWVGDGKFTCPRPDGAFPNPGTCKQFYACSNGTALEGMCEHATNFSPAEGKCVFSKVNGC